MSKSLSGISEFLFYKSLTKEFFKYSDKTTYEVLSSITSNEKLIGVLTGQWGDHGLTPKESSFMMHAMIANHYFDGGNYPVGGSSEDYGYTAGGWTGPPGETDRLEKFQFAASSNATDVGNLIREESSGAGCQV